MIGRKVNMWRKIITSSLLFFLCLFLVSNPTYAKSNVHINNPKQVYTYEKMTSDVKRLAKDYPDLIEYKSLGKTAYGRDIWAMKVGKGDATLLVASSHHAREWISTNLTMRMASTYASAYKNNRSINGYNVRETLDHTTIWFIPMVNPDGVTLQQLGLNAFPKKNHAQLIKMNGGSKNFKRWKSNAQGIDPNRNYNTNDWRKISSGPKTPSWHNYKGTRPAQIAEVQAVAKLVNEVNPEIFVDYHSSGEVLYWEYKKKYPNQQRDLKISTKVANMTGYKLMRSRSMPMASSVDWFMEKYGKPGMTPEIGRYAGNTNVPVSAFDRIWKQNEAVPLYVASESYQLWLNKQKYISLKDIRADLLQRTPLYSKPMKRANISLSPQRVSVVGEKANWYLIKTYKGNMWIDKKYTKEYEYRGFVDFKEDAYWAEPILWSVDKKLISGFKANNRNYLKPMDPLTEAQFLTILFRYAKPEELASTVPQSKYWASTSYQLASKYQLRVKGGINNLEMANATITRGEMAQLLAAFHFERPSISLEEAVQFMYDAELSEGYDSTNKTFENFGVNNKLLRAHISTFFMKYEKYLELTAKKELFDEDDGEDVGEKEETVAEEVVIKDGEVIEDEEVGKEEVEVEVEVENELEENHE